MDGSVQRNAPTAPKGDSNRDFSPHPIDDQVLSCRGKPRRPKRAGSVANRHKRFAQYPVHWPMCQPLMAKAGQIERIAQAQARMRVKMRAKAQDRATSKPAPTALSLPRLTMPRPHAVTAAHGLLTGGAPPHGFPPRLHAARLDWILLETGRPPDGRGGHAWPCTSSKTLSAASAASDRAAGRHARSTPPFPRPSPCSKSAASRRPARCCSGTTRSRSSVRWCATTACSARAAACSGARAPRCSSRPSNPTCPTHTSTA